MAIIDQYLSSDGMISCLVMDSTDMVTEMMRIHRPTPTSTAALGRLITAASMMGIGLKNPAHSLTLRVKGEGPAGVLIAVANGLGNAKAYMTNASADAPPKYPGKLDVGAVVGRNGLLTVIKDMGLKEPYIGQSALLSGEIAEDIAAYYAGSEQIPTVCGLGVLVGGGQVLSAGGFIAQLMPGAGEAHIELLERNTRTMEPITTLLPKGGTEALAAVVLAGTDYTHLQRSEPVYRCDCSRERVTAALVTIGADDLIEMAQEGKNSEVTCHFCDKAYYFTPEELKSLASESNKSE